MNILLNSVLALVFLILLGVLYERDERIEQLERQAALCSPKLPGERASAQMTRDGRIECAIMYKNKLVTRMEM